MARCGHEEAFCIGSAATAPQIRFVGGCAATEIELDQRAPYVWANGEVLADAGVVVLLESELPFQAVTSAHLVPTEVKTVVTARVGPRDRRARRPAGGARACASSSRSSATTLDEPAAARALVRALHRRRAVRALDDAASTATRIHLASAVETGHVLRADAARAI